MNLHPCPLCGESKGYSVWFNERLACKACDRAVAYVGRWRTNDDAAWNAAAAHAQGLREDVLAGLRRESAYAEQATRQDEELELLQKRIAELEAQRVPLTDEQIADAVREADLDWHHGWTLEETEPNRFTQLVRAIERVHGIEEVKN